MLHPRQLGEINCEDFYMELPVSGSIALQVMAASEMSV
jgi:hypothetical protein